MCAIREYFHFNMFKVDTWIHSYINDLSKWKLRKYLIYIWSLCLKLACYTKKRQIINLFYILFVCITHIAIW